MSDRDPKFNAYVLKIHRFLDRLDYYRLLGISPTASQADLKKTYYSIAKKFHPDRNRHAPPPVQQALYDIYKRITEAYRVLQNPHKRSCYDEALKTGAIRLEHDMRISNVPREPVDTIGDKVAREFFLKAQEELSKGNLLQADLHIKMALRRAPDNKAIRNLIAEILNAKKNNKR